MTCPYCGVTHFGNQLCPRVTAIEYYPDGSIKRVELDYPFVPPVFGTSTIDYPKIQRAVCYPEE